MFRKNGVGVFNYPASVCWRQDHEDGSVALLKSLKTHGQGAERGGRQAVPTQLFVFLHCRAEMSRPTLEPIFHRPRDSSLQRYE